jgi:hypothetical protein
LSESLSASFPEFQQSAPQPPTCACVNPSARTLPNEQQIVTTAMATPAIRQWFDMILPLECVPDDMLLTWASQYSDSTTETATRKITI